MRALFIHVNNGYNDFRVMCDESDKKNLANRFYNDIYSIFFHGGTAGSG